MGVVRVETLGSIFVIDEDLERYCRFPLQEGPRERPEWGGPDAGDLQDLVWHDYAGGWFIHPITDRLVIRVREEPGTGEWWGVSAPYARVQSAT